MLITIGIMVMIFCFSGQTRESSNSLSSEITNILIKIKKWIDSFLPVQGYDGEYEPGTYSLFDDLNHYVRKLAHLTEFAMLGMSVHFHLKARTEYYEKAFGRIYVLYSLLIGAVYAISDEVHQLFVSGRGAQVKDVIIDTVGVFLGIMISLFVMHRIAKKKVKA